MTNDYSGEVFIEAYKAYSATCKKLCVEESDLHKEIYTQGFVAGFLYQIKSIVPEIENATHWAKKIKKIKLFLRF